MPGAVVAIIVAMASAMCFSKTDKVAERAHNRELFGQDEKPIVYKVDKAQADDRAIVIIQDENELVERLKVKR